MNDIPNILLESGQNHDRYPNILCQMASLDDQLFETGNCRFE